MRVFERDHDPNADDNDDNDDDIVVDVLLEQLCLNELMAQDDEADVMKWRVLMSMSLSSIDTCVSELAFSTFDFERAFAPFVSPFAKATNAVIDVSDVPSTTVAMRLSTSVLASDIRLFFNPIAGLAVSYELSRMFVLTDQLSASASTLALSLGHTNFSRHVLAITADSDRDVMHLHVPFRVCLTCVAVVTRRRRRCCRSSSR